MRGQKPSKSCRHSSTKFMKGLLPQTHSRATHLAAAGGAARVSSWGGEPYIGQFFVFSAGEFSWVLFHTRPNSGGAAAPPRTPVQPGLVHMMKTTLNHSIVGCSGVYPPTYAFGIKLCPLSTKNLKKKELRNVTRTVFVSIVSTMMFETFHSSCPIIFFVVTIYKLHRYLVLCF